MVIPHQLPVPTDSEIAEGANAIAEAKAVADNSDLDIQQKKNKANQLKRDDERDSHLHNILIIGIFVVTTAACAMFLVVVWHMIAPQNWRFLNSDESARLKDFLFTGAFGGGASNLASRVLGTGSKNFKPK